MCLEPPALEDFSASWASDQEPLMRGPLRPTFCAFKVRFSRKSGEALGMTVELVSEELLRVLHILEGPLHAHNQTCGLAEQLRADDYIVEVNGVHRESDGMLEKLRSETSLEICAIRDLAQ